MPKDDVRLQLLKIILSQNYGINPNYFIAFALLEFNDMLREKLEEDNAHT